MFSDPQSVTYSTVAKSLAAISRGPEASVYRLDDSGVVYQLLLQHQFKARRRIVARLQRDSYSADPLVPANNVLASMTATLTIDFPNVGLTAADAKLLGEALVDWLSDSNLLKLANGET